MSAEQVRPTKKQRELLAFIESFIAEHGYSPSYREIMSGLQYTSVATVALHVNSLIKRGHLQRRDGKARSLEVVHGNNVMTPKTQDIDIDPAEERWLVAKIEQLFSRHEQADVVVDQALQELYIMLSALRVLGFEGAAQSFAPRLADLKVRVTTEVNNTVPAKNED
jgi:SOS-response transcriptional repressor LexA